MAEFVRRTFVIGIVGVCLCACALERAEQERTPNPAAGLYTPGSALGAADPTDFESPEGALGDRCTREAPDPDAVATEGELELDYMTQTVMAQYAPNNATAVWIEDADENYVATLEIRAQLRLPGLRCFGRRACKTERGPDVVSSASRDSHEDPHSVSWSGRDFNEKLVPDGEYTLWIEVTETDKADGDCVSFKFLKGTEPITQELLVDEGIGLRSGTLSWTPEGS